MKQAMFAILLCTSVAFGGEADDHGWILEIPEDEIRERVRQLEADPLGKDAKMLRSVLVTYFDEIDMTIVICASHVGPLLESRKRSHKDLSLHMIIASGDHLLAHPDQLDQEHVYQLAGLERVITVYERMIREKPKLEHPFMEDLRVRRDEGTLEAFVRAGCE